MKILNLYAGIGGNRRSWGEEHEITAVELDEKIAAIYQDFWPNDKVIVGDAHKYLEEHFEEFDFIWSSPPCPSHSRVRFANQHQNKPVYPNMMLYEEILFLKYYFKDKWCVENVISFYEPLIIPQKLADHYFWTNFLIPSSQSFGRDHGSGIEKLQKRKGFDLSKYNGIDKIKTLRNCVEPEVGKQILDYAINPVEIQKNIFE
jgi:DNA (cytosine-5)-methyltransferase 1